MNELVSLSTIQNFVISSVKNNSDFVALCNTEIGSDLFYHRDANISIEPPATPYFTCHKFNKHFAEELDNEYIVQFIIGLDLPMDTQPVEVDGVYVFGIMDSLEKIADKAIDCVKLGINSGGLIQCGQFRLADYNILITEVGETDRVQAIATLRFEQSKFL